VTRVTCVMSTSSLLRAQLKPYVGLMMKKFILRARHLSLFQDRMHESESTRQLAGRLSQHELE
jgi:hypothetical protein